MRLVTIDGREVGGRPGVLVAGDEILDLSAAPGTLGTTRWIPQSVVSVLAQGDDGIARVARMVAGIETGSDKDRLALRDRGALLPYRGTELLPPVRRPGLLLMVDGPGPGGVSMKNPNSAVGPGTRVAAPPGLGEERISVVPRYGLVLGRPLFAATREQAQKAIAGVTLLADLGRGRAAPIDARQFPGACPMGPAIVTLDELAGVRSLPFLLRINGHEVRRIDLDPDPGEYSGLLAQISHTYALRPGDVVAIGVARHGEEDRLGAGDRVSVLLGELLELGFGIAR